MRRKPAFARDRLFVWVLTPVILVSGNWGESRADSAAPATRPASRPRKAVAQAEDGTILLHARDVDVHGTTVRYEPQPNKNTIGYWTKKDDWVSWDFEVTKPGTFRVEILQGCGKGSGGSEVDFSIRDQTLSVKAQDTGGFQNFVARDIGTVKLDQPGRYTLAVKPRTKPGQAVMDLRQVTLTPATDGK